MFLILAPEFWWYELQTQKAISFAFSRDLNSNLLVTAGSLFSSKLVTDCFKFGERD